MLIILPFDIYSSSPQNNFCSSRHYCLDCRRDYYFLVGYLGERRSVSPIVTYD